MKALIIFALMAFAAADDDLYVLEKVNIDDLSSDIGELKKFSDCLIDKGPCTDLYKTYRDLLPESLQQTCKKCTVAQKHFAHHYFNTLKTQLPEDYAQFRQISDPENKYFDDLERELRKYKTL